MNPEEKHRTYIGNDLWIYINKYNMVTLIENKNDKPELILILGKYNIQRVTEWLNQINQEELL